MPKTQNPVDFALGMPRQLVQWAQTLHKVINGQITQGTPTKKDSTGQWNTFEKDNTDGILLRIGASGTTNGTYAWTAPNVGIVINHGLMRQPIGARLESSDKALQIYQTATPTKDFITIAPTDSTANATIYIF